jgi:hypothetical protein
MGGQWAVNEQSTGSQRAVNGQSKGSQPAVNSIQRAVNCWTLARQLFISSHQAVVGQSFRQVLDSHYTIISHTCGLKSFRFLFFFQKKWQNKQNVVQMKYSANIGVHMFQNLICTRQLLSKHFFQSDNAMEPW